MALIALGINHTTASVAVREAVAFAPDRLTSALQAARSLPGLNEIAILSTCNRMEIYADTDDSDRLLAWLANYHSTPLDQIRACAYEHQGAAAAKHMMKVAAGLDSLVLGEPQILGQMKSAYASAVAAGSLGKNLYHTFHKVFSVAKRVRSETAIGANPVSVAYAAVSLAQQIFSDLKKDTALLIGAGETTELVAKHLREQGIEHIIVANRTLSNAVRLAETVGGEAISLSDIPNLLHRADIVIASTASPIPILGKGAVEAALKRRRHKPMFMVDIAVPRNIEEQVGSLPDVYLYTVDDLKAVIDENRRSREQAALIALEIIDEGVNHYQAALSSLDAVASIRAFRAQIAELREAPLQKALKQLQQGHNPEQVLRQFAEQFGNKIMHQPSNALKQAAADGQFEAIAAFQRLFALDLSDPESPLRDPRQDDGEH
jgi:glutamyl-tRNA reductase